MDIVNVDNMTKEEIEIAKEEHKKWFDKQMADFVNIQPMNSALFKDLYDAAIPEEQLIKEGYEPVCPSTRLMWIKKDV